MNQLLLASIRDILLRDVAVLIDEVEQMPEEKLWASLPGVTNSVGVLALHCCGNLRHFIGAALAADGYQRDREREFSPGAMSREHVLAEIRITLDALQQAFTVIEDMDLTRAMPNPPPHHQGRSIGFFLLQLSCHLSRHTGQMNYLRRILLEH